MGNLFLDVLNVYLIIILARGVISFIPLFRPGWDPPPLLRPVFDLLHTLVDPPVNALKRVVPQPYGLPIDLAFLTWFLIIYVAKAIVGRSVGS